MRNFIVGAFYSRSGHGRHSGFGRGRPDDEGQKSFKPIPSVMPAVKDNAVTHEKVELGKLLFFDPRLSASEIISCNTCHNVGTGGVDAGPTSVGHGWQKGPRRAPTVYNAVFNVAQFWDGRAADLKAQAKGPVQASVEMNATRIMSSRSFRRCRPMSSCSEGVPERGFAGHLRQFRQGDRGVRSDADHARCTLRSISRRRRQCAQRAAKGRAQAVHGKRLRACHNGINVGGQDYFPFGVVENPGADVAAGRQGPLRCEQDGERRICVPRRAAAQRRVAGAILPFRSGVEPQAGGRRDGRRPNLGQADRQGRR